MQSQHFLSQNKYWQTLRFWCTQIQQLRLTSRAMLVMSPPWRVAAIFKWYVEATFVFQQEAEPSRGRLHRVRS